METFSYYFFLMFWLLNKKHFKKKGILKVLNKENKGINLIDNKEPKVIIHHTRVFFSFLEQNCLIF
jgi:hypothetical protein